MIEAKVEKPMSPEEWEINKDCDAKKRDHKYMWVTSLDPDVNAQCVHCGKYVWLKKQEDGYDRLGLPRK